MPINNNTLFPKVAYRYDSLPSTNSAAIAEIQGKYPPTHGATFLSEAQTAGRGQGSNHWYATPGKNLTLSIVAYPDNLSVHQLFHLTQLTGLAVRATVAHCLPKALQASVSIKWPNDVYVGSRKIAGILVQNGLQGDQVKWSVIGIGLNVNESDFPGSLHALATSLYICNNQPQERATVLAQLFEQVTAHYALFAQQQTDLLAADYHTHLYRRDILSRFQLTATGQFFQGVIRGVTAEGQLTIEQPVGRSADFSVGEIKLIRQQDI